MYELQICSRCLFHEVNSWMNENFREFDNETRQKISQELKSIAVKQGECIVCGKESISDNTAKEILRILEEGRVPDKIVKEFRQYFAGELKIEGGEK